MTLAEDQAVTQAETQAAWLDELKWDEQGLIPAIAQDDQTGTVLMVAWMNREALAKSAESGKAVYWSRSRKRLWRKGESSGNQQQISDIRTDCDADVILLKVQQSGGIACHTGRYSCFYRQLQSTQQNPPPEHQSRPSDQKWCETEPVLKDPREIYPGDK